MEQTKKLMFPKLPCKLTGYEDVQLFRVIFTVYLSIFFVTKVFLNVLKVMDFVVWSQFHLLSSMKFCFCIRKLFTNFFKPLVS